MQRQGITVGKATFNYLMVVGLISEDGSMDGNDLKDYAGSNLEKVLSRVPGVGEVEMFGVTVCYAYLAQYRQAGRL